MSGLPIIQGKDVINALQKIGYEKTRQKGSHIRLQCTGRKSILVPDHTIVRGLLRKILRDASISPEDFIRLL